MSFEMTGIEDILNRLDDMGRKVEPIQNKILNAQSDILLEEMKKNIRVDTGKTRDSLNESGVLTSGGERRKLVGAYKCSRAQIVWYLERGCARWKGKKYPFMRPSFYKCKNEMLDVAKEILEKEMRKG